MGKFWWGIGIGIVIGATLLGTPGGDAMKVMFAGVRNGFSSLATQGGQGLQGVGDAAAEGGTAFTN